MERICVVARRPRRSLETFIAAHVERLPGEVTLLHRGEGDFPLFAQGPARPDDGESILGPGELAEEARLRDAGVDPTPLHSAALLRWLQRVRPDVVLAEYGTHGAQIHAVCGAAGIPFVVHFHGYDAYRRERIDPFRQAYREMFGVASAVVAVSSDMIGELVRLGAPRERIVLNPCGADLARFGGGDPGLAPPLFVGVGRFVEKKAQHRTLEAFRLTLDAFPEARLVLAGDGVLLDPCRELARRLDLDGAVSFPGRLTHDRIAGLMRTARCFVQHSVRAPSGDSEGTPVAVLEAGATGLPVVATRHAGIRDVVLEEETGLLVDEHDVEAMAGAMTRVARDPGLAARLGANARRHVVENHSLEGSLDRLHAILDAASQSKMTRA